MEHTTWLRQPKHILYMLTSWRAACRSDNINTNITRNCVNTCITHVVKITSMQRQKLHMQVHVLQENWTG